MRNAQSTYKVTTYLLQKKILYWKIAFLSFSFRSFAIECAILQMLFAVCKKSARCELCMWRGKLYEPEIGRFFKRTRRRREKRKNWAFFSGYMLCSRNAFYRFLFLFSSVVMRHAEKKRKRSCPMESFIFFSSFDTHKKKYTNMWVVEVSGGGKKFACVGSRKSFMRTTLNHEMPTGIAIVAKLFPSFLWLISH